MVTSARARVTAGVSSGLAYSRSMRSRVRRNRASSSGVTSRAYGPTAQRLVSYLVSTTPPGKVRVSTRFRFTQLSSAVKNGVPSPTRTG